MKINTRGIAFKFVCGSFLATVGAALFVLFIVIPRLEASYLADRKASLEQVVDMANSLLTDLQKQVASGKKPLPAAQQEALRTIGAMRYRGNGYLWINDLTLHDPVPERVLTDRLAEIADDPVGLRRDLVEAGLVTRTRDGAEYWRTLVTEFDDLEAGPHTPPA